MMSLSAAKILGLVFSSLGYGVFFVMFVWNAYLQVRNLLDKNAKRPNKVLLVSSILLFMMVTGRWVIGVYCFYDVIVRSGGRVSISAYFADLTQKWQICATSFIEFEIIVVDFILIYRLYYVWKPHWWVCIFPILAWIGGWISAAFLIWAMNDANPDIGLFQQQVERWSAISLAFTIANNVYCTAAIIFRLWRSRRAIAHITPHSYMWDVLRIFVESASLATTFMMVTFISFFAKSNILYLFLDAASPVIGISFLLIFLRLNFIQKSSTVSISNTTGPCVASVNYPLRMININVAQQVDINSEIEGKTPDKGPYGDMA